MRLFLAVIATGILAIVPVQSEPLDGGKPTLLKVCGDHVGPAKAPSTKVKTALNHNRDDMQHQKYVHRSIAAESLDDEPLMRRYAQEMLGAGPSTGSDSFRRIAYDSRRNFGGSSRRAIDNPPSVIAKEDHPDEEHPDIDPRASFSSGVGNDVQRASESDGVILERALETGENSVGKASTSKAEESAAVDFSDPAIRERRKKGKRRPHYRPRPRPRPRSRSEPQLEWRALDDEDDGDGDVQQLEVDPRASFSSEVDRNNQGGSATESLAMERSLNANEKSEIQNVSSEKPGTEKKPTPRNGDMESSGTINVEDPAIRERRKKGKRRPHYRPRPRPRPRSRPEPQLEWRALDDDDDDGQQLGVDPRASFPSEFDDSVRDGSAIEMMERYFNADGKSEVGVTGSDKRGISSLVEDSRKRWRLPKFSRPKLPSFPKPKLPSFSKPKLPSFSKPELPNSMPKTRPRPGRKPKRGRKPRRGRKPNRRPRPRPHDGDTHTYVNVVLDGLDNAAQMQPDFMPNPDVVGDANEDYDYDENNLEEDLFGDEEFTAEEEMHGLDGIDFQAVPLQERLMTHDGLSFERRSNNAKENNVRYSDKGRDSMAKIVQRILSVDGSHSRRYGSLDNGHVQSSIGRRNRPNSETLYWS